MLLAALVAAGAYTAGVRRAATPAVREGSVDVGFVRDMSVHHAQAVTLAMIALDRATVPAVRDLAEDIVMEQQREIGVFAGWLEQWNLPATTTRPPMWWMRHAANAAPDADPPMPGMATRAEVARLAVTRGRAADAEFCRLILAHHVGGLHMIEEVIERGNRPEVIGLAQRMRTSQRREVTQLNTLLAELQR
jgi:uncharacterized protein (DUF305 family)